MASKLVYKGLHGSSTRYLLLKDGHYFDMLFQAFLVRVFYFVLSFQAKLFAIERSSIIINTTFFKSFLRTCCWKDENEITNHFYLEYTSRNFQKQYSLLITKYLLIISLWRILINNRMKIKYDKKINYYSIKFKNADIEPVYFHVERT